MNIKKQYIAVLALLCLVPTVSNVQGVEANVPNNAATAITRIDTLLAQPNRDNETAVREISNLLESTDVGNERYTVFRHIETKIKAGLFANDVLLIEILYGNINKMSSDEMDYYARFFVDHKEHLTNHIYENIERYAFHTTYPRDNCLKALYTLRGELKSQNQTLYKELQIVLTPGLENTYANWLEMSAAAEAIKDNNKKIHALTDCGSEDIERERKKFEKNRKEAFEKFEKNRKEALAGRNKHLNMCARLKVKFPSKNQEQKIFDLNNEIAKYLSGTMKLRRNFEKVLGFDIARKFFIELGVLRDKIIGTSVPANANTLQNVVPENPTAPRTQNPLEEEHKD